MKSLHVHKSVIAIKCSRHLTSCHACCIQKKTHRYHGYWLHVFWLVADVVVDDDDDILVDCDKDEEVVSAVWQQNGAIRLVKNRRVAVCAGSSRLSKGCDSPRENLAGVRCDGQR